MPKYYDTGFGQLERSYAEEERRVNPDLGAAVGNVVKGFKDYKEKKEKKEKESSVDYFNKYVKLRQAGVEPEIANERAKEMTGYTGKDFVSAGFEEQTKRELESKLIKSDLSTQKELLGLQKTQAEIESAKKTSAYTKDQLKDATTLRKEFDTNKAVKNFNILQRSVAGLRQAADISLTGKGRIASDQALAVLFQKMLDPDSVVRESEYARTPEGAAMLSKVRAYLPKLQKGGLALINEDRQAIVEMGERLLEEGVKVYNRQYDRFDNIAKSYGTDPKLIFGETLSRIELKPKGEEQPEESDINFQQELLNKAEAGDREAYLKLKELKSKGLLHE